MWDWNERKVLNFYELKLNSKDPVYMQLAYYVKKKILLKEVRLGERLPSRREVAAQLGVNPNTVQKAFKLMESEGYVQTSGTQGSTVYVDAEVLARIEQELTEGLVRGFIQSARKVDLSFKQVIDLISDLWED